MRDENIALHKKAGCSQLIREPVVQEAGEDGLEEKRGDWSVRVMVPQKLAVFDTRIFNANAPSYKTLSLEVAFNIHRNIVTLQLLLTREDPLLQS